MQFKCIGIFVTVLLIGIATVAFGQGGGAGGPSGGAVGANAGVPGAAGNSSADFGRSSASGSAGTSTGPTNPSGSGASNILRICRCANGAIKSECAQVSKLLGVLLAVMRAVPEGMTADERCA